MHRNINDYRSIEQVVCLLNSWLNASSDPKWRTCEVIYHCPIRTPEYYTPHVGTSHSDWPMLINSFRESDWFVQGPLSAVTSSCQCTVCVWYSKAVEKLGKSYASNWYVSQRPAFQQLNLFCFAKSSLDLLGDSSAILGPSNAFFEVVCGQQLVPV